MVVCGPANCSGPGMKRSLEKLVSKKLSPLEREAVALLFSGMSALEVMRRTGMSVAQIEGARERQFQHMGQPRH